MSTYHSWKRKARDRKKLYLSQHAKIKQEEMKGTVFVTHADGTVTEEPIPTPRPKPKGRKASGFPYKEHCRYCDAPDTTLCPQCGQIVADCPFSDPDEVSLYVAVVRKSLAISHRQYKADG